MLSILAMKIRRLLISLVLIAAGSANAKTLDDHLVDFQRDGEHSPFVVGPTASRRHPKYLELLATAKTFRTSVRWVSSIPRAVLALPHHPDRHLPKPTDELDGWFDEFTTPNRILLHDQAPLITLIHELRHAVQLGQHGLRAGTWFDRLLQKNVRAIRRFKEKVDQTNLHASTKKKLKRLATRLVETCSEISAHEGDLILSRQFNRTFEAQSYERFIHEYQTEFENAYFELGRYPITHEETFAVELRDGLKKFIREKNL